MDPPIVFLFFSLHREVKVVEKIFWVSQSWIIDWAEPKSRFNIYRRASAKKRVINFLFALIVHQHEAAAFIWLVNEGPYCPIDHFNSRALSFNLGLALIKKRIRNLSLCLGRRGSWLLWRKMNGWRGASSFCQLEPRNLYLKSTYSRQDTGADVVVVVREQQQQLLGGRYWGIGGDDVMMRPAKGREGERERESLQVVLWLCFFFCGQRPLTAAGVSYSFVIDSLAFSCEGKE